jgi:hypothetical protein
LAVEQQNGSTYTQMLYSQVGKTAIMNGQALRSSGLSDAGPVQANRISNPSASNVCHPERSEGSAVVFPSALR